ncbi:unnamed protein product [Rhizophagus irregularis]|nr:unnamed protein product [Rhizophagus irregularis]
MITKHRQKKKKASNKGQKVLCNCLKCQNRNLVSISTRTRHRKKFSQNINNELSNNEQESSNDEQEAISANEQESIGNESQRLSDTEILDLESNYELIFEDDSNNTSDSELMTDSSSVSNNSIQENTNIQLPPGFPEALRLLEIKAHSNMTNDMYSKIMEAFSEQHVSLYRATKKLENLVSIEPIWIDCCVKSCCAFTGNLKNLQECPTCKEGRYKRNSKKQVGRKKMAFFPLKNRFIIQYQNPTRSLELQYRNNYTTSQEYLQYRTYGDIFDGRRYQELVEEGHFIDYRDIALTASLDGYNIFKQKTDDCWIILFINANIQPENRVKRDNLLIGALIPGPSAPGNLNSFLRPVIDELKELECKYLNYLNSI